MKSKLGGRRGEKIRRGMKNGDKRFHQANDRNCGSHKRSDILQGRRRLKSLMTFPWSMTHKVHFPSWQRSPECRKCAGDVDKGPKNCWCCCCWCKSSCIVLGQFSLQMMDSHEPRSVEVSRFERIQWQDWRTLLFRVDPSLITLTHSGIALFYH